MDGFSSGLYVSDADHNPSIIFFKEDVRTMLLHDPVYSSASNHWEVQGGPAFVKAGLTGVEKDEMPEFAGNEAAYVMAWYMTTPKESPSPIKYARDFYQAAWLYARFVVARAAKALPSFGDRNFYHLFKTMTAVEQDHEDGSVSAVFSLNGAVVGHAKWLPRKCEISQPWKSMIDDGVVLEFATTSAGTEDTADYILRHLQSRGCRHVMKPPEGYQPIWERHGYPAEPGSEQPWQLCRISWPTCKTEKMGSQLEMPKTM
jgi:hypothetical protein